MKTEKAKFSHFDRTRRDKNQLFRTQVMTGFRQLSLNSCDGIFSPWSCSGLAVVSRHNFTEIEFNSYGYHGYASKALIDGEILASKGHR